MHGLEAALTTLTIPDLWQQEAVRHLRAGKDVILDAPTGSGKTWVFEKLIEDRSLKGQAVYTVPTRALANDKRSEWKRRGWNVGLVTGDIVENPTAPLVVATLETQRERLMEGLNPPAMLVIDEYQMLADPIRGVHYEVSLAMAPLETQLLLMSGSVANAVDVQTWLKRLGRNCEVVSTKERPVPLEEMPVEQLPHKAPREIEGFWPRLATEVLLAGLGPLLIFAPHRAQAEKLARQIAAALPADDPLSLTERQQHVCGKDLANCLEKRVAWHHSGLSYQQRAGLVEPLAKAGKLRVVVATMGLAAGINFSMRSVCVSDTRFFDGAMEREISRDELLQMFGRAGRRGLDSVGYLITTRTSPRLSDGRPLKLRRTKELDWTALVRVMDWAAEQQAPPFEAAQTLAEALFSEEKLDLGLGGDSAAVPNEMSSAGTKSAKEDRPLFGLTPTKVQIMNSVGAWEDKDPTRQTTAPLEETFIYIGQRLEPAPDVYGYMASHFTIGRVTRLLLRDGRRPYGRELALAMQIEGSTKEFTLTRNIRELLKEGRSQRWSMDQIEDQIIPRLKPFLQEGRVNTVDLRGDVLVLKLDFSKKLTACYRDQRNVLLVDPDEQQIAIDHATTVTKPSTSAATTQELVPATESAPLNDAPAFSARKGSPVWAWRKLGLIESDGTPTRRGKVFSFFQQGEGLAIAAGLEDTTLPIDELLVLLANLRAGVRFGESPTGAADRLAHACRNAYGTSDFEGYLNLGLPPGYGEAAAEFIGAYLHDPGHRRRLLTDHVSEGDLERAFIEWLSLLRHISHQPDLAWDRWSDLKKAAATQIERTAPIQPTRELPEMPAVQLAHRPDHHLTYARLRFGGR